MQKFGLIILLVTVSFCAKAQDIANSKAGNKVDSLKTVALEQAALMYPQLRQFSITHTENGFGQIRSELDGKDSFEGKFRSARTTINMNIPVLRRKNNTLFASIGAVHQFYYLKDITSFNAQNPINDHRDYMPMVSMGVTYIRKDSIFGKPVTFTASAKGLFNPSLSRSQFTFTGVAMVPLIQTENSRLIGGAVVLLDPASPTPFLLMVSYYHKFKKWDMDLMATLPHRVALRKEIFPKTSLTLFTKLGGSNSFFEFADPVLPTEKLVLSSLELKSGLKAEYRLTQKSVISLSTGVNYMINSKIRENNSSPDDYFLENKHDPAPFVQVGFSLLPFWKGLNL